MDDKAELVKNVAVEWAQNMAALDDSKDELEWLYWLRQALFSERPDFFPNDPI